ncbi:MAG TPA: 3-oxoacyl-[acyl-carrier-protein] synthase III C-terminal domain-containing protein [Usitatibacter sp.]|jgi:alkylresorcinol/alkylpyrone synthase|nr:3-oxoacyl-[acyl-carrier-protein] synthase III C-terminal domain-containing protein [Usitatibacter sp.]
MYFAGLGTAVPERSFTQAECWQALERARRPEITPRTRAILQGILTHDNGIERRSLALENLDEGFELDPDTLHRRFVRHAPALASEAAGNALREAALRAGDIDAVVVSTCTGYLCPGLTSYVAEALQLRPDTVHLDLVGQGCGAALPNLATAEALLASRRADHVLSVCVEVCSAAFYLDDDLGVLVSACLFGDGAAAAVISSKPREGARRVRWRAGESLHAPRHRDALRFEQRGGMLRNILTLPVPKLAADHARAVLDSALAHEGIAQRDVAGWVMHAGGRKVLAELQQRLGLAAGDVRISAAVLNQFGNLSSPFVLFVLKAFLDEGAPGGLWWMSSFGAGFSCHGALLEVA